MRLLKEIVRSPGLRLQGKTLYREAVRGIILQQSALLLIHSAQRGDYKFPGGGVEGTEAHAATLKREIQEECGATLTHVGPAFGQVVEYALPQESDYAVFKMASFYYPCAIEPTLGAQRLDPYERDLGFTPVWVAPAVAIAANKMALQTLARETLRWTERETFVLELILEHLQAGETF